MKILNAYRVKKQLSSQVADLYRSLSPNRHFYYQKYAEQIDRCGTKLLFGLCRSHEYAKLLKGNFCNTRHCVICMFRRSLRQAALLFTAFWFCRKKHPSCRFLFLTLTFPNCDAQKLGVNVTRLSKAWARLLLYRRLTYSVLGSFRSIECTYNDKRDDYNLHMHAILCVKPGYFTKYYVKQGDWLSLWRKAFQDDRITQVDVQAVKDDKDFESKDNQLLKAAFELGKYLVKSVDFKNEEVLKAIHDGFHKRRLRSATGLLKDALRDAEKYLKNFEGEGRDAQEKCPHCHSALEKIWHMYLQGEYVPVLRIENKSV